MSTLEEKIKVMQAAADGKPIEMRDLSNRDYIPWMSPEPPVFNWGINDYRIKEESKKKVKLYQVLCKTNAGIHLSSTRYYKTTEEAQKVLYHMDVIKLLPHTEIEVEID